MIVKNLLLVGIISILFTNCTLYKSPDLKYQNKTKAITYYYLAMEEKGQRKSPLDYLDKSLSYSIVPASFFEKGEYYLLNNEIEKAKRNYKNALLYSKNYALAKSRLKYLALLEKRNMLETISELSRENEKYTKTVRQKMSEKSEKVKITQKKSSGRKIKKSSKLLISTTPYFNPLKTPSFHYELAQKFYNKGLYRESKKELKIIIKELKIEKPEYYLLLLKNHFALHDYNKAVRVAKILEKKYPKNFNVLFTVGNFYLKTYDYEKARNIFLKALKIKNSPKIYNNLGIVYKKLGYIKKAKKYYEKAISLDEKFADPYLNLGILYEQVENNIKKALYYYEIYVKLNGKRKKEVENWIKELKLYEENK